MLQPEQAADTANSGLTGPGMDLYIYYRAECAHAQALAERARTMQSALSQRYGVTATLKRRPEAKDGSHTWMEIYLNIPENFDAILAQALMQSELAALIDGERHTEYFLDVTSCA